VTRSSRRPAVNARRRATDDGSEAPGQEREVREDGPTDEEERAPAAHREEARPEAEGLIVPGKKYRSIKRPKVYEALRRDGMSKKKAARISNALAKKQRKRR
jgi:hypothetical protein